MTSEELKKCPVPWCGGNAVLNGPYLGWWTVRCELCGCKSDAFKDGDYDTNGQAEAIAQWNERPTNDHPKEV